MDDTTQERWLPVPGYEGRYEVSDHGRVRRLAYTRRSGPGRKSEWQVPASIMRGQIEGSSKRHRVVTLSAGDGTSQHLAVHLLVLRAFVGEHPPDKPYGLHGDDDAENNTLSNLRWGTAHDNQMDAVRNRVHGNIKKDRCKRGHPLAGPNLKSQVTRPHVRTCRACANTHTSRSHKRKQPPRCRTAWDAFQTIPGESFDQEADRRYLFIMEQAAS